MREERRSLCCGGTYINLFRKCCLPGVYRNASLMQDQSVGTCKDDSLPRNSAQENTHEGSEVSVSLRGIHRCDT